MFPLQPALTGGQGSSKILRETLELPSAQLWLWPAAPRTSSRCAPKPPHAQGNPPAWHTCRRGTEARSNLYNLPQPSPSPEGSQQILGRPDPTVYILSCHHSYYCPEVVMLLQSAWVHQDRGCIPKHTVFPFAGQRGEGEAAAGAPWPVAGTPGTVRTVCSSDACSRLGQMEKQGMVCSIHPQGWSGGTAVGDGMWKGGGHVLQDKPWC